MKLAPVILALAALMVQVSCTTGPHAGDIVSEKIVHFAGKRYVQQRIVLSTDPYETELRTIQIH